MPGSQPHGEVRVYVDQELCYGAQTCALAAPGGFIYDDDGKAKAPPEPWVALAQYRDAEAQCPAMAITLRRAGAED